MYTYFANKKRRWIDNIYEFKITTMNNKYDILYEKLVNERITTNELKLLNHLAFGTPFMNSINKGELVNYE